MKLVSVRPVGRVDDIFETLDVVEQQKKNTQKTN